MKRLGLLLLLLVVMVAVPVWASADSGKDGHGKGGKHGRHEYREAYRDGNCKVVRKWERDGDFKEQRKCKGPRHEPTRVYVPAPDYAPAPVYVPAPAHVIVEPGITIHGTVRLPH